ncbi:hypothetical protein KCP78_22865 [Salmonella enterica subsp. enterica]|nr:hypothetical protein KCP78_22865 [Salmonella enterica subsp. enterica]
MADLAYKIAACGHRHPAFASSPSAFHNRFTYPRGYSHLRAQGLYALRRIKHHKSPSPGRRFYRRRSSVKCNVFIASQSVCGVPAGRVLNAILPDLVAQSGKYQDNRGRALRCTIRPAPSYFQKSYKTACRAVNVATYWRGDLPLFMRIDVLNRIP